MADALTIHVNVTGDQAALGALRAVRQGMADTHAETVKLGAAIGVASAGATLAFQAMASAAGAALGAIGHAVIGVNGQLEQANIAFTTMLGSGEKAADFLKELQQFAATTPFEFPQLLDVSKKLMAMGFAAEQVRPMMTAVGNAAAALGSGSEGMNRITLALGQMQAKAKVSAEEMMQLTEAGIPAWQMLATKIGVTVPEAMERVSKGAVESGTFIAAFQEGVAARFGNMMEAQAKTWDGLKSTIMDTLQMGVAEIGAPLTAAIRDIMEAFAEFVQGEGFSAWVASAKQSVTDFIPTFKSIVASAQEFVSTAGPALARAWEQVSGAFSTVATAARDMWDNLEPVLAQLASTYVGYIQGIRDTLGDLGNMWGSLTGMTDNGVGAIQEAGSQLIRFFHDALAPVAEFVSTTFAGAWQELRIQVVEAFNAVAPTLQELAGLYQDTLGGAITVLQGVWSAWWGEVGPTLQTAWSVAQPILIGLKDLLGQGILASLQNLASAWRSAMGLIASGMEALAPILGPIGEQIGKVAHGLNEAIRTGLADLAPTVAHAAEEAVTKTRQAFIEGTPPVAEAVTEMAQTAAKAATRNAGFQQAGVQLGHDLAAGVQAGIEGEQPAVASGMRSFTLNLVATARDALQIRSPSRVAAEQIGKPIVEGIAAGIDGNIGIIHRAMGQTIRLTLEQAYEELGAAQAQVARTGYATGVDPSVLANQIQHVENARYIQERSASAKGGSSTSGMSAAAAARAALPNVNTMAGLGAYYNSGIGSGNAYEAFETARRQADDAAQQAANATYVTVQVGSGLAAVARSVGKYSGAFGELQDVAARMQQQVAQAWAATKATAQALMHGSMVGGFGNIATGLNYSQIYSGPSSLIPRLATGGLTLSDGLAYLHRGERVLPAAEVQRGGGGTFNISINIQGSSRDDWPAIIQRDIVPELRRQLPGALG